MAKLEIPVNFGTGVLFGGIVVLLVSLWAILGNAPWLATTSGTTFSVISTYFFLRWVFLIFAFVLIVMGIRRIGGAS
ncbi:MAG: hypothetical protein ACE5EW_06725 [Thermoplasmata archaeon]